MALTQIYQDNRFSYKSAKYYSRKVPDTRLTTKLLNPNGQEYSFVKGGVSFRCGVYENKKSYGIALLDGISVTDGTLVLLSSDSKAMNIKRGDRVVFEGEGLMVTNIDFLPIKNRNTQFQRITNNQIAVITLT